MCSLQGLIASEPGLWCPRGEALPQMCFVVSFLVHSTGRMQQEQDCSTQSFVCEERASRAQLCFSCYPYTKHLLGTSFLVIPSCGAAAKQAPTCLPEGASQPGPGRKRGEGMCVCENETKVSVVSIPGDFSLKRKKNRNFCSLFPACFPWRE